MKIARKFYLRDANEVARDLLGKILVHRTSEGTSKGRIVEVEAYIGPMDAASHAFKNLKSNRTKVQFGLGGYAYIYLLYGIHYCFNVVTNEINKPEVVLVRALEPIEGINLMFERRKTKVLLNTTNGPGKLCSAMGISMEHYGLDLCGDVIFIENANDKVEISSSPRINIDYAGEAKDYLWRYFIKGNEFVSR